ncbi:hypothetical protein [Streptomyces spectabilis]|uniref:hypothetical protein n=1 Tax=Streptomyces spectabilis TaxID=68270 RepID=UPI001863F51D|nr:hypothetical protein [Streptomyces spectabilis]
MERFISYISSPALGDIRAMAEGDTVWLTEAVEERADWGRILDALSAAISRGVAVRWL